MSSFDSINVGNPVSLIWYFEGDPYTLIGTVFATQPFVVEASDRGAFGFEDGTNVRVLFQNAGSFETATAVVKATTTFGSRTRYELEAVEWEKKDRREFVRYEAQLLVRCRYISDEPEGPQIREFTVTTKDVSLGGAWVRAAFPAPPGTILNCEIQTSATNSVRVLALVAWSDPNGKGFGVEFIDFVGASKSNLSQFIAAQAA